MTNAEAFNLIGTRTKELTGIKEIQDKMIEIAKEKGTEEAQRFIYKLAIATLCGKR